MWVSALARALKSALFTPIVTPFDCPFLSRVQLHYYGYSTLASAIQSGLKDCIHGSSSRKRGRWKR
jgi:hypothetical protein